MKNIIETAREDARLTTLVRAIAAAGMDQTLASGGRYTLFAPTDEAFSTISEELLGEILSDRRRLTAILAYHVVSGKLTSNELQTMESIKTLQGDHIDIDASGEALLVNGARILEKDIESTNGICHIIDALLIPRMAEARIVRSV